jgi:hypothetical protein
MIFLNKTNQGNPTSERNKYMVLRLDFSKLQVGDTMGDMKENFNKLVCPLLKGSKVSQVSQ